MHVDIIISSNYIIKSVALNNRRRDIYRSLSQLPINNSDQFFFINKRMSTNFRTIARSGNLFGIFRCRVLAAFFRQISIYKNKVIHNMNKDESFDLHINDISVGQTIKDVPVYGSRFVTHISTRISVSLLGDSIAKVYYLKISIK